MVKDGGAIKTKTLQALLQRIGSGLSLLREKKGFVNISDFANAYNLPVIQYWRIEKGKANITIRSLIKVLIIHQLTVEEFFCWLKHSV
jgi:hypothetical protein